MTGEQDWAPFPAAANAASAEHLKPSPWPALTSQQLNLADGKRAQSGEKSVPHDFLPLSSARPSSALNPNPTPTHTHNLSYRNTAVLPLPPTATPPLHYYTSPPNTLTPSHHSVAHVISEACLASPSHPTNSSSIFCPPPPKKKSAFQHDKPHGISQVL